MQQSSRYGFYSQNWFCQSRYKQHFISAQTEVKGKQLANANHVCQVQEYRKNSTSYKIDAQVIKETSITLTPYNATLHVSLYWESIFSLLNI